MVTESNFKFSRRSMLKLMGSASLLGFLGLPKSAQAVAAPIPFAPPPLMHKDTSQHLEAYKDSLIAFVDMIQRAQNDPDHVYYPHRDRLLDMAITLDQAEAVSEVYALDNVIRDYPFYSLDSETPLILRTPSYQDGSNPVSSAPNVGPTMEFVRGATASVWVTNNLDVCGKSAPKPVDQHNIGYTPHNFDWANLHTHGLHVEPNAPSDDVSVTVKPKSVASAMPASAMYGDHSGHSDHSGAESPSAHGLAITAQDPSTFPYFYDVRADHPVGTFWYHPHMHGSVAAQITPGMAGALITRSQPGETDFDEILQNECNIMKPTAGDLGDERIMVLQAYQYNTVSDGGVDGVYSASNYYNEKVAPSPEACFGLSVGEDVTRLPTSVNGLVNPVMTARPGEILRLRMINATDHYTYLPKFKAVNPVTGEEIPGADVPEVYAIAVDGIALLPVGAESDAIKLPLDLSHPSVATNASAFGPDTPYFAIDYGLTDTPDTHALYWTTAEILTLCAAQRLDVLVKMPAAGEATYQLYGAGVGEAPTVVTNDRFKTDDIVRIQVSGAARTDQKIPTMKLFDNATTPGKIERPPLAPSGGNVAPTGTQSQWYGYVHNDNIVDAPVGHKARTGNFQINGNTFDANFENGGQVQLKLNELTAWELYSINDPHSFHIHVNAFAVHGRYYAQWRAVDNTPGWPKAQTIGEESVSGWPFASQDSWPETTATAPYLMPVWRDTLYFDEKGTNPGVGGTKYGVAGMRVLATSYQVDYTGKFVLHCHDLYHEDNGMMLSVEITA